MMSSGVGSMWVWMVSRMVCRNRSMPSRFCAEMAMVAGDSA